MEAVSFAVKSDRRCDLVFSVKETAGISQQTYRLGMFVSNSTKETTFCYRNEHHLDHHVFSIYWQF